MKINVEHLTCSNQELVAIYGPEVLNTNIGRPVRTEPLKYYPKLTEQGLEYMNTEEAKRKLHMDFGGKYYKIRCPQDYTFPSFKMKDIREYEERTLNESNN
jgi:hypothetical protein